MVVLGGGVGRIGDCLMPDNPKPWADSRNKELGLVSSYVNNRTDGCIWVLNQNKGHRRRDMSV